MTAPERKTVGTAFRSPSEVGWRELMAGSAADKDKQEEARKAKDELKNVLLASLQMQHLVVLAGFRVFAMCRWSIDARPVGQRGW